MLASTKNLSSSANNANLTVTNANSQSISTTAQMLVYNLQTTQLLKMLSRIFPTWECKSEWLHKNVKNKGVYTFQQGIVLRYQGQPGGVNTEHHWQISVDTLFAQQVKTYYEQIVCAQAGLVPVPMQPNVTQNTEYPHLYNGLNFRSPAEVKIAAALEKKGVLFFANARCRIHNRSNKYETKEADFLVCYQGKVRILEVDGREYHVDREKDYKRDRLFDKEGLFTSRFSASECLDNPDEVVAEFLDLCRI